MLVVDSLSDSRGFESCVFSEDNISSTVGDKPGDYMRAENIIHNYTLIVLMCEIHNTGGVM